MIRPFTENDYEAVADIWNAVNKAEHTSAAALRYFDSAVEPPLRLERVVAEQDGAALGMAEYGNSPGMAHPQKFFLRLYVRPECEGRGLGTALYDRVLADLQAFDPLSLRVQVSEANPRALSFAQKRGFAETKRDWVSVLDVRTFNASGFENLEVGLAAQGIALKTLADLGDSAAVRQAFFELFSDVRQDVPRSEPATPFTFETFSKFFFGAPDFSFDATFVALHGADMVGLTHFWTSDTTADLDTGLTGVQRAYRGKGVATALKIRALRYAKKVSATKVTTDNDTNNASMLAVNEKLGFKRLPASISLLKTFGEK